MPKLLREASKANHLQKNFQALKRCDSRARSEIKTNKNEIRAWSPVQCAKELVRCAARNPDKTTTALTAALKWYKERGTFQVMWRLIYKYDPRQTAPLTRECHNKAQWVRTRQVYYVPLKHYSMLDTLSTLQRIFLRIHYNSEIRRCTG